MEPEFEAECVGEEFRLLVEKCHQRRRRCGCPQTQNDHWQGSLTPERARGGWRPRKTQKTGLKRAKDEKDEKAIAQKTGRERASHSPDDHGNGNDGDEVANSG